MQNKKLLSVLLSLVLVCTCIAGMLILNVSGEATEREAVYYDAANDGELETKLDEIEEAEFTAAQKAVIRLSGNVEAWVENGVLFGFETKFDKEGNRLPIEIIPAEGAAAKSVAITFADVSGDVACANSYTFKDIGFYAADAASMINFYAGSGEVVLKNVDLVADPTAETKNANVNFYADNFTANAFANWEAPEALIQTSLTLDTVDYSWSYSRISFPGVKGTTAAQVNGVGWTGTAYEGASETDAVKAENVAVTLKIVDSKITGVHGRPMNALSPVASLNLIVEDTSEDNTKTVIPQLTGIGNSGLNSGGIIADSPNFGKFEFIANIEGGAFGGAGGLMEKADQTTQAADGSNSNLSNRTCFFRNVLYDGDLTINISGGVFATDVLAGYGDGSRGSITGTALLNVSGGKFNGSLFGPNIGGTEAAEGEELKKEDLKDLVVISGSADIKTYQGNRVGGSIQTTVNGTNEAPVIENYYGSYSGTTNTGGTWTWIVNNINGGKITNYFGTGYNGTRASKSYVVGTVENNMNGGVITTYMGAGNVSNAQDVINNMNGTTWTTFHGSFPGVYNTSKKTYSGDGTGINGTLKTIIPTSAAAKVVATTYWVGGSMPGDVEVVVGTAGGSTKTIAASKVSVRAGDCVIGGNVDITFNSIKRTGTQDYLNNAIIEGDLSFLYNKGQISSHFVVNTGTVQGDLNVEYNGTTHTAAAAGEYRRNIATTTDVGGDIAVTYKGVTISGSSVYVMVSGSSAGNSKEPYGLAQDGNVRFTLDGVTQTAGYIRPLRADVGGTYTQEYLGTNVLKEGLTAINYNVGTLETTIGGSVKLTEKGADVFAENTYYGSTTGLPVANVINNIKTGAVLKKGFYGTGAAVINVDADGYVIPNADGTLYTGSPVGTFAEVQIPLTEDDPATEDVNEATYDVKYTYTPGNVTNNIYGGTIGDTKAVCPFFGTGDQTIDTVTTTMTGGTIAAISESDATLPSSNGCYYGNYGLVTGSVTNNIYGGSIGNNFYASHGDLTCPIYNNMGNNLYAELYPEAEAIETSPWLARVCFAGGRFYETVDGEKVYALDAKTGSTGPVYINVDGLRFGRAYGINNSIVGADADGYSLKMSFKNTTASSSQFYFQNTTAAIEGNVDISFENFNMLRTGKNGNNFTGPKSVKGDVNISLKNCAFKEYVELVGDVGGNLIVNISDTQFKSETFDGSLSSSYVSKIATGEVSGTITATIADTDFAAHTTLFNKPKSGLTLNLDNVDFNSRQCSSTTIFVDDIVGDFNINAKDVRIHESFNDISGAASLNLNVKLVAKYENCFFGGFSTQFHNRGAKNGVFMEFDSCTFARTTKDGSITLSMQDVSKAGADEVVFVYGDTVVGGEFSTSLYLGRQGGAVTHLGAKPDADGNPVPTETTLTIHENGGVYADRNDQEDEVPTTLIYDVTVKGTGILAPCSDVDKETEGYQYDVACDGLLTLVGNLMIPAGENPQIYLNAAEDGALVSPAAGESWEADKVYVTVVGADDDAIKAVLGQISALKIADSDIRGVKTANAIVGKAVTLVGENSLVSMELKERIYIKLWIPKANVVSYFEAGCTNVQGLPVLDVGATLTENGARPDRDLGWVSIDEAYVAENTKTFDGKDYVIVLIGSVAANDFNTQIEFFANEQTVLGIEPGAANTMLTLAKTGVEMYKNEAEVKDLFNALYNYGATACGLNPLAAGDVDGVEEVIDGTFVEDVASNLEASVANSATVQFKSVSLLMGDAIGYRFNGKLAEGASASEVIVKVNGAVTNNYTMYVKEDGSFKIDVYVSFGSINETLDFEIVVNDATLNVESSLKGYSEQIVSTTDSRTLALAQLVQAVYNMPAQN